MFYRRKKEEKISPEEMSINIVIYQIYNLIVNWASVEEANASKGKVEESNLLGYIKQFNFEMLTIDSKQLCADKLDEIFAASPMFLVPNRMQLLAAQITLRFGSKVIDIIKDRLTTALVTVWKCDEEKARALVAEYPCLWVMFIVQASPVLSDLRS